MNKQLSGYVINARGAKIVRTLSAPTGPTGGHMKDKEVPALVLKAGFKAKDLLAVKEYPDRFVLVTSNGQRKTVWKDDSKNKAAIAASEAPKGPKTEEGEPSKAGAEGKPSEAETESSKGKK